MEIKIFKDKDNIYFKVNSEDDKLMNFDNLVELSETIIKENFEEDSFESNINCNDSSLKLYESTIETLINSLLSDTELLELLRDRYKI